MTELFFCDLCTLCGGHMGSALRAPWHVQLRLWVARKLYQSTLLS